MTERYASLKYKVHLRDPSKPLDVEFPELFRAKEIKSLKSLPAWEKVVIYIVFIYSKDTGLISEYPTDLKSRKESAAIDAGFTRDAKGAWPEDITKIMAVSSREIVAAIMAFLIQQNNVIWTEISVSEQELFEFQKLRLMSIDTGDGKKKGKKWEKGFKEETEGTSDKDIYDAAAKKDKLLEACDKRIKHLESLYSQFYGDHKNELLDAEFTEMITPETAERIVKTMEAPYENEIENVLPN